MVIGDQYPVDVKADAFHWLAEEFLPPESRRFLSEVYWDVQMAKTDRAPMPKLLGFIAANKISSYGDLERALSSASGLDELKDYAARLNEYAIKSMGMELEEETP